MSTQYSLFRDYRGLPPFLYLELASHMTRQVQSIPESLIDIDAAIARPGSWEWHTEDGFYVRRILKEKGYETIEDPKAPWRVRWQQKEAEKESLWPDDTLPTIGFRGNQKIIIKEIEDSEEEESEENIFKGMTVGELQETLAWLLKGESK
jgi:hypothetical protein